MLIDGWRKSWKLSSMQLNAFALACDAVFVCVSVWDEKFPMNPIIYAGCRMGLTCMSMLARIVKQRGGDGKG